MSMLSDYQMMVERPQKSRYEATIADLRDRLAKAEAERDAMREALRPFAEVTVLPTGAVVGLERFWFERAAALVAGQEEAT